LSKNDKIDKFFNKRYMDESAKDLKEAINIRESVLLFL
jgi:urocanate hydratase